MLTSARHSNVVIQLIDEVLRLHGRLRTIFGDVNAMTGLAPMESTVLAAVVEAQIAPTVPQIGRSLGHPRQVIQRAANALIAAGLICTEPNPHHRRAPLLLPTDAGHALKHMADERAVRAADALLQTVGERTCKRLTDELRTLRSQIEAHLRKRDETHAEKQHKGRIDRRTKAHGLARRQHSRAR